MHKNLRVRHFCVFSVEPSSTKMHLVVTKGELLRDCTYRSRLPCLSVAREGADIVNPVQQQLKCSSGDLVNISDKNHNTNTSLCGAETVLQRIMANSNFPVAVKFSITKQMICYAPEMVQLKT